MPGRPLTPSIPSGVESAFDEGIRYHPFEYALWPVHHESEQHDLMCDRDNNEQRYTQRA